MNFEICEEFKEHFYDVHQFHYLDENKRVNLKFSWVLKTIVRKNEYWRKYYLTRFINTLPRCYRITVPELFNRYIEVGKSSFIEALYEQTQQNAKAEGRIPFLQKIPQEISELNYWNFALRKFIPTLFL